MSTNSETKLAFDPVLRPFADFWSDYSRQVNEATRELFSGFDEGTQIKTWQRKWMNTISQSMDAYMRTPEFLRAMKHQTETAVQLKRKADDWTNEIGAMPTFRLPVTSADCSSDSGVSKTVSCIN